MNAISPWLVALAMVGLSSGALPARASYSLEAQTSVSMLETLPPASQDAHHLNRLADHIQHQMNTADDTLPMVIDFQQLPLLGNFLDKDGNLNLPLGLTLYSTMGDTSIGFGTQF
ncbi:hypothetical protein GFS31_25150 [Leptolyngbya sp. BL0902]|nr:hypothetical protein GFS31_25150 [Leptolyngbya sp. BL0902]